MIREEVQKALHEEMPKILRELKSIPESKSSLKESTKDMYGVPLTLNQSRKQIIQTPQNMPAFANNKALNSLLQETMLSMTSDDADGFGYNTEQQHPGVVFQPREDRVGSVDEMLSTARGAGNIEAVQVNVVPDFSALMDRLLEKGDIK
jgi:hypothetical protein